jgi:FMN phosphatase YigB (HAD superfamily)
MKNLHAVVFRAEGVLINTYGELYRDIDKSIEHARMRASKLGLVSTGYSFTGTELDKRPDIIDQFDAITSAKADSLDQLSRLYEAEVDMLEMDPQRVLVVETDPLAVEAAKKIGCRVLAITRSHPFNVYSNYDHIISGRLVEMDDYIGDNISRDFNRTRAGNT